MAGAQSDCIGVTAVGLGRALVVSSTQRDGNEGTSKEPCLSQTSGFSSAYFRAKPGKRRERTSNFQHHCVSRFPRPKRSGSRTDERDGEAIDEKQCRDAVISVATAHKVEVAQETSNEECQPHTQADGTERSLPRPETQAVSSCAQRAGGWTHTSAPW